MPVFQPRHTTQRQGGGLWRYLDNTVDGSEIPNNHLGYINLVNNGINYQTQQVSRISSINSTTTWPSNWWRNRETALSRFRNILRMLPCCLTGIQREKKQMHAKYIAHRIWCKLTAMNLLKDFSVDAERHCLIRMKDWGNLLLYPYMADASNNSPHQTPKSAPQEVHPKQRHSTGRGTSYRWGHLVSLWYGSGLRIKNMILWY